MKRLFLSLCAAFIGLGTLSFDAEAKRLGGGSSFGMSRNSTTMQRSAPAAPTQQAVPAKPGAAAPAAAPQPSGMSRWLGPLAGIAAGIGLAALLSHFGMGEGMANILLILALVMGAVFLFRLLTRKRQPEAAMQYAGAGAPAPQHFEAAAPLGGGAAPAAAPVNVPAGFDVDGFLRQAKVNFVRLQAANDAGNLADIREFTTPEMFAEVKLEFDERRGAKQETDVMELNAALLDLTTEEHRYIASVRFSGLIREAAGAAPEHFDEAWHLTKPVDGATGWVVAGIQQFQ